MWIVEYIDDASDRRAILLASSLQGAEMITAIAGKVGALEDGLLSPFSDEEINQMGVLLERLEGALQETRSKLKS